jgi:AcrR family transcriptional regulator
VSATECVWLGAARQVFPARGYHGATPEQIAKEAGSPKGVVYLQSGSKAGLFLARVPATGSAAP